MSNVVSKAAFEQVPITPVIPKQAILCTFCSSAYTVDAVLTYII